MFITVQFPLVDYRCLQDPPLKLELPEWPDPDEDEGKILYFGKIFKNRDQYLGPWDGEKRYCEVKKVISFCGVDQQNFYNSLFLQWEARIAFRRFQSDGKFLGKFEVGFDDFFEKKQKSNGTDPYLLKQLIYEQLNKYLLCPVKIKKGSRKFDTTNRFSDFIPFIHSGNQLASSYYWATYKKGNKRTFEEKAKKDNVEKCEPIVIVEIDTSQLKLSNLPIKAIDISDLGRPDLELYFDFIRHYYNGNYHDIKCWIIGTQRRNNKLPSRRRELKNYDQITQNLRINLIRLHSEVAVLKKVLERMGKHKPGDLNSPAARRRVVNNLHKIFYNLSKYKRNSLPQQNLVQVAMRLEETISENDIIEDQIKGLEYFIEETKHYNDYETNQQIIDYSTKFYTYMGDQISIGAITGNFINKSQLVNSLNTANNGLSEEFKQELIQVAKKIEESQNQSAAVLLNSINEELAKPQTDQNKSKIKSFWDGLVKVMPDIATIGKTIASVISLF